MKEIADFSILAAWLGTMFAATLVVSRRWFGHDWRSVIISTIVVLAFLLGSILHPTTLLASADSVIGSVTNAMTDRTEQRRAQDPVQRRPIGSVSCAERTVVLPRKSHGALDSIGIERRSAVLAVPDGNTVSKNDTLVLRGWIIDDSADALASVPCLIVDGQVIVSARPVYHIARPDVGAALKNQTFVASGFDVRVPAAALSSGVRRITVGALSSDGLTTSTLSRVVTITVSSR